VPPLPDQTLVPPVNSTDYGDDARSDASTVIEEVNGPSSPGVDGEGSYGEMDAEAMEMFLDPDADGEVEEGAQCVLYNI
jgi:hypothetical protein